jgi:hypothetical protein
MTQEETLQSLARRELRQGREMIELREGRLLVQIEPSMLEAIRLLAEKEGISTGEFTRFSLRRGLTALTGHKWEPQK